jgi:putative Holliday junction resolvase
LALSDASGVHAFKYRTLDNSPEAAVGMIRDICQAEGVKTVVIGLPLNQRGQDGPAAQQVRQFAAQLKDKLPLEVVLEDERFSTAMAAVLLREAGKSAKNTRPVIDQGAAQIILQTYLDRHHG